MLEGALRQQCLGRSPACPSRAAQCRSQSRRRGHCRPGIATAARSGQITASLATFPADYTEAIKQAQTATQAALADGCKLIEIEFPPTSLSSVPGDGEGANEMTYSLQYLRKFCRSFQDQASSIRIFFPDEKEMAMAKRKLAKGETVGGQAAEPRFEQTNFQLDFLTQPTGFLDLGLDIKKVDVAAKLAPGDTLALIAYPHFNVNEMIAVEELWRGAAKGRGLPIITFNGELDRIRSGYYPPLFYPKIGALAKEFIPLFTQAFYLHNFKGGGGGALFRVYPEPWQVLRRDRGGLRVVHTQEEMPSLKEVALDILPRHP